MSTDQTDHPTGTTGTTGERPGTLDEALGGSSAPDIRSLWDGLVDDPTTDSSIDAPPASDPLAGFPLVGHASASAVAPPAPPLIDRPPARAPDQPPTQPPAQRRPDSRPTVPEPPVVAPDTEDDNDDPDVEIEYPSRQGRRAARKAARRAALDEKDQRRSERLELRRHRILPRTVIGISMLLLAAAVGAAASGAGLYAYYDWRLSENEDRVGTLTATLESRLREANADIEDVQARAINDIRTAAAPLEQLLADTRTVSDLTPTLAPSVFFISTLDTNGAPSVGSGFVVSSDSSQSLILTSYRTVAAATATPAPAIEVRGDDDSVEGTLHSWDEDRDLALIIVDRGDLPALTWASDDVRAEALGRRVYVASGLGGAGVSLSPGLVIDQSASGLQHSAPVGNAWQGGPLLTAEGEVLGIASVAYAPLGFDPGGLPFAVPIDAACERVLTCSGDGTPS